MSAMILVDLDKLRKMAVYVGATQEVITKHAALEDRLRSIAPTLVDVMVQQGHLSTHLKESKLQSFVDNPQVMCEDMEKIASMEPAPSIGSGVNEIKEASVRSADQVFEDGLFSTNGS